MRKPVESIAISEFKATCLAVFERVRRTGASALITHRGVPIAEITPPVVRFGWISVVRLDARFGHDRR